MHKVQDPVFTLADAEILAKETLHQGFFTVQRLTLRCRLYQGGWSREFQRELMLKTPGVGVLLYDPDRDQVLLVEQFRAGCLEDARNGPWALELVAGICDSDESTEQVAIREAQEEAGLDIRDLIHICEYYNSPGGSNERLTVYCAGFDASHSGGHFGLAEEHEDIRAVVLSRVDALAAVQSGRINNAMSIIALQWLQLNLPAVRQRLTSGKPA